MYSLWFPDSCHLHGSLVRLFFGAILLKIKYIIPEVAKENKQDPPVYLMADELRKSPILDSPISLFKESHEGEQTYRNLCKMYIYWRWTSRNNLSQFWVPFPTNKRLTLNKHDDFGICCCSLFKNRYPFNVVCFDFSWGHPEPTTKVYRIYPVFPV